MVMENEYGVAVNGIRHQLQPGDLIIIPSGTIHEIIAPPTGERYYFQIDRERLLSVEGVQEIEHCFYPYCLIRAGEKPQITARFLRAIDEYRSSNILGHSVAHLELSLMLIELAREVLTENTRMSSAKGAVRQDQNQLLFVDVCSFIANHCTENLQTEDIAKKVGYSKSYFERIFSECIGISFHAFLVKQRLNYCKRSLIQTDEPIANIAHAAGFNSIATFNRSFQAFEGMSPSDYRKLKEKHLFDPMLDFNNTQ